MFLPILLICQILCVCSLCWGATLNDIFSSAQWHQGLQEYPLAIKEYEKVIASETKSDEVFWSLLQLGKIQFEHNLAPDTVIDAFLRAYYYNSKRVEPLFYLAEVYRKQGKFEEAYQTACKALKNFSSPVTDSLLVEQWIYDYGLLWQLETCAYMTGNFAQAETMGMMLLRNPNTPLHVRKDVQFHLKYVIPGARIMTFAEKKWGKAPWLASKAPPYSFSPLLPKPIP